jgi:hypothetical protein
MAFSKRDIWSVPDTPEPQEPVRPAQRITTTHSASLSNTSPTHGPFGQTRHANTDFRQSVENLWDLLTSSYMDFVPADLSFLQLSCVCNEAALGEGAEPDQLLEVLRRILRVSPEERIKEKIVGSKLYDLNLSIWVHGIMTSLFCEFVFDSGSLFDDASILLQCLIDSKICGDHNCDSMSSC